MIHAIKNNSKIVSRRDRKECSKKIKVLYFYTNCDVAGVEHDK